MMNADTWLMQSLGASMVIRLSAPGSQERTATVSWRRTKDWQVAQLTKLATQLRSRRHLREQLQATREHDSETDAWIELLKAHQLRLEPPASWVDPRRTP